MQKDLASLDLLFREARAYSLNSSPQEVNVRFESMKGLFSGSKKLFVHCDYIKEILSAVEFSKKYGVKLVIVGGYDSFRVADVLKSNNVPVILGRSHSLPAREDDDYDQPYKLPYLLKQAGVEFAISVDGSWQNRNLMFNAGTGAGYGLTKEEALSAITSSAARILGIDQTTGTLEEGKDANIVISNGDALDMRTNNIENAFISGRQIDLDNIQKQLYNKYITKYGLDKQTK
jgi:imidazolonepropionase-like amidohydrolase